MAHWWPKIPALTLLAWALGTAAAQAQVRYIPVTEAPGQVQTTVPFASDEVIMSSPAAEGPVVGCPDCMRGNATGNYPPQGKIRACLARFGVGCWAHHDEFGCDSCESELRFIFGSCRAFFRFNCQPGPPIIPVPDGYTLPPGH